MSPSGQSSPPLVRMRDFRFLVQLPLFGLVSWFVPRRYWMSFSRRVASAGRRLGIAEGRFLGEHARFFGRLPDERLEETALESLALAIDSALQTLRCYRPGRWLPNVQLQGRQHVQAALDSGRGVILWVAATHHSGLVAKIALAQAGYSVGHLSNRSHGGSNSRLGIAVLNRISTGVEDRFLDERIRIARADEKTPVRRLLRRLDQNRVVSITVTSWGLRVLETPLERGGFFRVAPGAPRLAESTGTALLPVFTHKTAEEFKVVVHPPLDPGTSAGRRQQQASFVRQMGRLVEGLVRDAPEHWTEWSTLLPPDADVANQEASK